jgi:hypothetical protein
MTPLDVLFIMHRGSLDAYPRPPRSPGDSEDDDLPMGDPPDEDETDDPDDEDEGEEDDEPLHGARRWRQRAGADQGAAGLKRIALRLRPEVSTSSIPSNR